MICQTEIGPELCAKSGQQDCGKWLNCNADAKQNLSFLQALLSKTIFKDLLNKKF